MGEGVMSAVNGARTEKPRSHIAQQLSGALLTPLVLIGSHLYKISRWFRDEWRLSATIRELNRLNDHYLDDIGIKRGDLDLSDEALVKRLRTGR
jgi:uncharacterized protein YjiS (DUF1127 family)